MTTAAVVGAVVLAAIAAVAMWRVGRGRPLSLLLQPVLAATLWLALWPPAVSRPRATLVVATAHASQAEWARHRDDGPAVALPEAPLLPGAQRLPALATALRRLPGSARVRVLGDGLAARDREALQGRAVLFTPAPPRVGLHAIHAPTVAVPGQPWPVRGRATAPTDARVELLDPAGARVAQATLDADGAFTLAATPAAAARVDYVLSLREAGGRELERIALPLDIVEGRRPRLWLLAGGPDPEQKFLRRWAEDAGWTVRARASLGGGVQVGDPMPMHADALAEVDLLVLDQRALRALGAAGRASVRRAVGEGLGLLLRLQEAPGAEDRAALREFGFATVAAAPAPVHLPGARAPFEHEETTLLTRAPLQAGADDAVTALRDAEGLALARWRAQGRGRVGVAWIGDAYRLVLSGQAPLYGQAWTALTGAVARATAAPGARLRQAPAWEQQRALVCGLVAPAQAIAPDGRRVALAVDARGCAAWWPAQAGWHRLGNEARTTAVPVLAAAAWPAVRAAQDREATLALQARSAPAEAGRIAVPGPRWPFFLAWLLACALAWWLERRRRADEPQADAG